MQWIESLSPQDHDAFVNQSEMGTFMQNSEWGTFKSRYGWKPTFVGIKENGKLTASAMILFRKIPGLPASIAYAPRGLVLDYENQPLLEAFSQAVLDFCRKKGAAFFRMDPALRRTSIGHDGKPIDGIDNQWLIEEMEKLSFDHQGFSLDFDGWQPRYVFWQDIDMAEDDLFKGFHKKWKYNIRLAQRKGIEIVLGSRKDLPRFAQMMEVTGSRDGFGTRPLSYFEALLDDMNPAGKAELFLARLNPDKAIEDAAKALHKEEAALERYQVQLASAIEEGKEDKRLQVEKKQALSANRLQKLTAELKDLHAFRDLPADQQILSGAILMTTGKKACYLYGASDNRFRDRMPNYLIQWEMMRHAQATGATIYDFRGVSGNLSPDHPLYGLYRFKRGFEGEFVEYIGEFDAVLKPACYWLFTNGLPKVKALLKRGKK
jgi:peptidoglycan pentaglycine glycine transferase (the first glycine)